MKTVQSCPYCGTHDPASVGRDGIFFRCSRCDLIGRRRPRTEMPGYYENGYFEAYAQDQLSGARGPLYGHILDRIEKEFKGGRLLDVGCGCGFFLQAAEKRGWDATGIDPSAKSVQYARSLIRGCVLHGTMDTFGSAESFRVITLINVLDHLLRPWDDLRRAHQLLEPGGLVFIRLPNGRLHFRLLRWLESAGAAAAARRFFVIHEFAMTPRFIRRLLSDCGFREIRIGIARPSGTGFLKRAVFTAATLLASLSCNRLLLAPSLKITARKESA